MLFNRCNWSPFVIYNTGHQKINLYFFLFMMGN